VECMTNAKVVHFSVSIEDRYDVDVDRTLKLSERLKVALRLSGFEFKSQFVLDPKNGEGDCSFTFTNGIVDNSSPFQLSPQHFTTTNIVGEQFVCAICSDACLLMCVGGPGSIPRTEKLDSGFHPSGIGK